MVEEDWVPLRKGISRKNLAKDTDRGYQMDLLRIEPGFIDKGHYHGDYEWVYVLEGSLEDEKGLHKKGDFFINEKGGPHQPKSKDGCLLLIFLSLIHI